jgi:hypothetical protein
MTAAPPPAASRPPTSPAAAKTLKIRPERARVGAARPAQLPDVGRGPLQAARGAQVLHRLRLRVPVSDLVILISVIWSGGAAGYSMHSL